MTNVYHNFEEFLRISMALLQSGAEQDIYFLKDLSKGGAPNHGDAHPLYIDVKDGNGDSVLVAMQLEPNDRLRISARPTAAIREVVDFLRSKNFIVSKVQGSEPWVTTFAEMWANGRNASCAFSEFVYLCTTSEEGNVGETHLELILVPPDQTEIEKTPVFGWLKEAGVPPPCVPYGQIYVARDAGQFVCMAFLGFHRLEEKYRTIHTLYTPEANRGKGYGRFIVERLIKIGIENSRGVILYVEKENANAIDLYEKLGFKRVGDYSCHAFH